MTEWHFLPTTVSAAAEETGTNWDLFVSSLWPLVSGAIMGTIPLALAPVIGVRFARDQAGLLRGRHPLARADVTQPVRDRQRLRSHEVLHTRHGPNLTI